MYYYHQHKPEAEMHHLISTHPDVPELSCHKYIGSNYNKTGDVRVTIVVKIKQ
jgi:hypothetical protein